jgi:NAD(P)-dependent dehydrogenase (short-subunit alcohol dehydrogenase family)
LTGVNRSVLVTGGNRGIGLAIARAFVEGGDRVAVTHRGSGAPEGLFGVKCDVTDTTAVDEAFAAVEAEQGAVEVLVSNAGIAEDSLLMRMSEEAYDRVLDTNLSGAFRVAKRAIPSMLKARQGRLIFISSVIPFMGIPGSANYAASKAGLIGLARTLAGELGTRGVTSNVVLPGFVETDLTADIPDSRREMIANRTSLKRFARAAEIAAAVRFLGSDEASYITGAVLPVDGGLSMGT